MDQNLEKEFIQSLSEKKELQAYLLAKQHLGSLFDISNCNGFLEFKAQKAVSKKTEVESPP